MYLIPQMKGKLLKYIELGFYHLKLNVCNTETSIWKQDLYIRVHNMELVDL